MQISVLKRGGEERPKSEIAPLEIPDDPTIEHKEGICGTERDTLCGNNAAVYQRRKKLFQRGKQNEIFNL